MVFKKGHKINIGRKFSEDHKKKISESHKNHKYGMFGKKHSKKTIEKMKNSNNSGWINKGDHKNIKTEFKKNYDTWNKGVKTGNLSKKHKEKISKAIIRFYDINGRIGKLNKLLRSRSMWKIWREAVFLRDNFTCQNPNCEFCNNKIGVMLHPHHIKPLSLFPNLVFNIDNGITYCAEFHIKSGLHDGIQQELSERRKE